MKVFMGNGNANRIEALIFETKILRKIFGPNKQADGSWRIKTNEELDKLIKGKSLVSEINSRKISWLAHQGKMEEHGRAKKKLGKGSPIAFRLK